MLAPFPRLICFPAHSGGRHAARCCVTLVVVGEAGFQLWRLAGLVFLFPSDCVCPRYGPECCPCLSNALFDRVPEHIALQCRCVASRIVCRFFFGLLCMHGHVHVFACVVGFCEMCRNSKLVCHCILSPDFSSCQSIGCDLSSTSTCLISFSGVLTGIVWVFTPWVCNLL